MTTAPCRITPGETRMLHHYPATVLSGCEQRGDWHAHRVRFDTLAYRSTCGPVDTSAFCWEFGPAVPSMVHN